MPLKSSSPSFRQGATFATIGAFVVDLWNNQSIARWFFVQNGIYFFLGLVWGFFGSAFGLGSDFGFGSSTGLGFGSGFGFSAGGLEKVKFFHEKQKQNYCGKQYSLFSLWIGRHHCCDLFLWSESNFVWNRDEIYVFGTNIEQYLLPHNRCDFLIFFLLFLFLIKLTLLIVRK